MLFTINFYNYHFKYHSLIETRVWRHCDKKEIHTSFFCLLQSLTVHVIYASYSHIRSIQVKVWLLYKVKGFINMYFCWKVKTQFFWIIVNVHFQSSWLLLKSSFTDILINLFLWLLHVSVNSKVSVISHFSQWNSKKNYFFFSMGIRKGVWPFSQWRVTKSSMVELMC